MLCEFRLKMLIYAPFGGVFEVKWGKWKPFAVLSLQECNNPGFRRITIQWIKQRKSWQTWEVVKNEFISTRFYFRSSSPREPESVTRFARHSSENFQREIHVENFHQLSVAYVIAVLLLIYYVSLWPWPFISWSVVIHGGSHIQRLHQVWRSWWLSVLELWVLIFPTGYNWECVCRHCACAVSRDLCMGQIFPTYLKSLTLICLFTEQLPWLYD